MATMPRTETIYRHTSCGPACGGYRFLHRDFFACGKEVSSTIWLRPEAALGKITPFFRTRKGAGWAREVSNPDQMGKAILRGRLFTCPGKVESINSVPGCR